MCFVGVETGISSLIKAKGGKRKKKGKKEKDYFSIFFLFLVQMLCTVYLY